MSDRVLLQAYSDMAAFIRRGANWTPPPDGARAFHAVADQETCLGCRRHISQHYGGTEYRCEPRSRPFCRDCADRDGTCDDGTPCGEEKL